MKKAMYSCLMLFVLLVFSGCSNNKVLYAEEDTWISKQSDLEPDVKVSGELLSQTGCMLTYTVIGNEKRSIDANYVIYRRVNGEWKQLQKKYNGSSYTINGPSTIKPEESKKIYIDWSYEYGKLPRGTYKIETRWFTRWNRSHFIVEWIFELPAKGKLKGKPYGYTGIDSEEVKLTASSLSDQLWVLDAEGKSTEKWSLDYSYALYKMKDGEWRER